MPNEEQYADYGNLDLIVSTDEGGFQFRVIDKSDCGVYWAGTSATMDEAKKSALFEAQTFIEGSPPLPQWRRRTVGEVRSPNI
ncbi:MAG: hypothetical protein ABIR70_23085 [Bryobacteraceae bacterium]